MTTIDTSFRTALRRMDRAGRLRKVRRSVDIEYEISSLMTRYDGDSAIIFEDVTGYSIPVVANLLVSPENCEAAFDTGTHGIRAMIERALSSPLDPVTVASGPAQQVVVTDDIDLGQMLPVLRHSRDDNGRFITGGVVIVRDPETGVHNASYHRLQISGPDVTGIQIDVGRHLGQALQRAKETGQTLPVAVCIGTDLSLMYAAAFMGAVMPPDADELRAASGMRGAPLEMVDCVTQELAVPAETEIVLEGFIDPDDLIDEGPFAEFVGHYSDTGLSPSLHITAVTHRDDAMYFAVNGTGRETIMLRKYVLEMAGLTALRSAVPMVRDVDMSPGGLHRFHMVIQVEKGSARDEGLQRNAMLAAFAALKDLDMVIAVDGDIDIRDPYDVEYALATRMEASKDLILIPGARGHEYVRASNQGQRTKLGIDATVPFDERDRYARVSFEEAELENSQWSTEPGSSVLTWLDESR